MNNNPCRDITHGWDPCTLARVHLQNSRMLNGGERFRRQVRWIRSKWEVGGYQSLHGCVWVVIYKCSTSHQISYRLLPIILRSRRALVSSLRPLKEWRAVQPSLSYLLSGENDDTNHWKKHRPVGVIAAVVTFVVIVDKFRYDHLMLEN
jgi:hypothetical protein